MTILGGTGMFSQATGFAIPTTTELPSGNYIGTFVTSSSGQITAPGLKEVPEPSTAALLGAAIAALPVVIRKRRKAEMTSFQALREPITAQYGSVAALS